MTQSGGSLPGGDLRGVDHVAIAVYSLDAACEFYVSRLGLNVVHEETLSDPEVRLAYLDAGNVMIQLVEPSGPGRIASFLEARGEGLHHVCFLVDNIGETLRARSLPTTEGPFMGGRSRPACFLSEEPNGVVVELTELRERSLA